MGGAEFSRRVFIRSVKGGGGAEGLEGVEGKTSSISTTGGLSFLSGLAVKGEGWNDSEEAVGTSGEEGASAEALFPFLPRLRRKAARTTRISTAAAA